MMEDMQALQGQENLDAAPWNGDDAPDVPVDEMEMAGAPEQLLPDHAALPEKFRGKSVDEIIDMYRHLEADYGRKGQLLGEYEQRLARYEDGRTDAAELADDLVAVEASRLLPAAQAEYQRLVSLGLQDSPELQAQAWAFARQQDAYLQQSIARGIEAHLAPYATVIAPAVYSRDVQSVLAASPVPGIEAGELAEQIAQAGIPPQEWTQADPQQRALFIVTAAKQLAYEKYTRGELASPGASPVAPAQHAPAVLGRGQGEPKGKDPAYERAVANLAETMGLSREAAMEVLRGE